MGGKNKNLKKMLNAVVRHPRQVNARRLSAKTASNRAKTGRKVEEKPADAVTTKLKGKSKEDQFLHPEGRLAAQLRRKFMRKEKKMQHQSTKERVVQHNLERPLWFKKELLKKPEGYYVEDMAEMAEWVQRYIARNDAQISRLAERRRGSPRIAGLERDLCLRRADEREEFIRGFKVPDLLTRKSCQKLRVWPETQDTLVHIPEVKVVNPDASKPIKKVKAKVVVQMRKEKKVIRVPGTDVKTFTAVVRKLENRVGQRLKSILAERKARRHAIVAEKRMAVEEDTDPIL